MEGDGVGRVVGFLVTRTSIVTSIVGETTGEELGGSMLLLGSSDGSSVSGDAAVGVFVALAGVDVGIRSNQ